MKTEITLRGDRQLVKLLKEALERQFEVEWGVAFEDAFFGSVSLLGEVKGQRIQIELSG